MVYLHCCPSALAPHVEWALAGVLGSAVRLEWTGQPATPQHLRAEASWTGAIGTAAKLAASLRAWPMLVFEVTEDGTADTDGERLAYVPGRGFHRRAVSANGDVVVGEERLRGPALLAPAPPRSTSTASPICSGSRGTPSSSRTASAATAPPSRCCTRSSDPRR